ncbi:probable G-protein coupled receptor Mth-like 11 [Drosophila innubila]|uniref:probable G-protein coupled receptor Mth-like 11 n=1 Tax=Drosophila innubila TaxID=198719 RepID=UPI00148BB18D|nr:probable G-protein coupled receptor Mth-like 11 [Drosophila innubila]
MDEDPPEAAYWKPAICTYSCALRTDSWSAMIYYYGPISILLLFNIMFFVSTARWFYVNNRDIDSTLSNQAEKTQKQQSYANFVMFLRFFIIYVVVWFVEIISYLMGEKPHFWIDAITSAQGIILFILTIFRKEVLVSISDRLSGRK